MNFTWINLLRYMEVTALVMGIAILLERVLPCQPKVRLRFLYLTLLACLIAPLCLIRHEQIAVRPRIVPIAAWQGMTAQVQSISVSYRSPFDTVLMIIVIGALLRLLWLCFGFCRLAIYRRRASLILPLPDHVREQRFRRRIDAPIYYSDEVNGPVTFGWVDPAVLLPRSFVELEPTQQSAIVCHELLHVQRNDGLAVFGEELLRSLLWFHPGVWWLLGRIQLCREQVVDAETIELTEDREVYLETLIAFAERKVQPDLAPATAFFKRSHLLERVKSIANDADMPARIRRINTLAIYTLMPCALTLAVWMLPLQGQPRLATDSPGVTVSTPYELLHRAPVEVPKGAPAGLVTATLTVSDSGEVMEAHVTSGPEELQKSVLRSVREWHFNSQFAPPRQFDVSVRYAPNPALIVRQVDMSTLPVNIQDQVLREFGLKVGQSVSVADRDRLVRAMLDRTDGLGVHANTTPNGELDLRIFQGQESSPPVLPPATGTTISGVPGSPDPVSLVVRDEAPGSERSSITGPDHKQPLRVGQIDATGVAEPLVNQFNIHVGDMISVAEIGDRFQELRQLDKHLRMYANVGRDRILSIHLSAMPDADSAYRVALKRIDASGLPEPLRTHVLERFGLREGDTATGEELRMKLAVAREVDEHVDARTNFMVSVPGEARAEITFVFRPRVEQDQAPGQSIPKVIYKPSPEYPPLAMQNRLQGTVRFAVTVQPEGNVSNIQLIAGHPLLVPAATEAMKQYRFEVKPAESKMTMDINFVLPPR